MLGKGLIVLFMLAASALMAALTRRRAAALEARGGCVACGAQVLDRAGAEVRCRTCGYTGAADGGGALTEAELHAIHNPEAPRDR